jgi:hypothetical protein
MNCGTKLSLGRLWLKGNSPALSVWTGKLFPDQACTHCAKLVGGEYYRHSWTNILLTSQRLAAKIASSAAIGAWVLFLTPPQCFSIVAPAI